jgi:8-oxo-dGTP pyrophosphatase MutT (NUDIX family)
VLKIIHRVIDGQFYDFVREAHSEGITIALLPFRREQGKITAFLAREEICPAHSDQPELCCLTGGFQGNIKETARVELWEEAGYTATVDEFIVLGTARPTKSSDTLVYLFAIDVSDKLHSPPPGDGTYWEERATIKWVTYAEGIYNKDPLFVTAITRLLHLEQQALPTGKEIKETGDRGPETVDKH